MKKYKYKNLTKDYLKRSAYRYLEKYATSEANLIFILTRKADKIIAEDESQSDNREHVSEWVKEITASCVKSNLVNDRLYAEARVNSFLNSGNSLAIMKNKLRAKGVPTDIISDVIGAVSLKRPNINLQSCIKYARKRRFGPFRTRNIQETTENKEQASMARAGFHMQNQLKC